MKNYIKTQKIFLSEDVPTLRKLDAQVWKEIILSYVLTYYKEVNNEEIQAIIKKETMKSGMSLIETRIKEHIREWFRKNRKFQRQGFIVNTEPSSEGEKLGFYDLKFQHSYWNYTNSYFGFECKNLGKGKSISEKKSLNEYVYVKEKIDDKAIEDGGMYRYFIGKYAVEQGFGGMIGFVISKTEKPVIQTLVPKIYEVYSENSIGQLTKEEIIEKSIFDNANTFDTIHIRKHHQTQSNEEFRLHHIIMDFYE